MGQIYSFVLSQVDQSIKINAISFFYSGIIAVPVIEVDNNKEIRIGYLFNRDFIPSPVKIFDITINSIAFEDESKNKITTKITTKLEIYHNSNQRFIEFKRDIVSYSYNTEWDDLARTLYYLNKFMKVEGFIENLNISVLNDMDLFVHPSILYEINSLKFRFSDHCISRVGKDDMYWKNVYLKNLPFNNYRIALYAKILGARIEVGEEPFLSFEYDNESGYCSYSEGNEFYDDFKVNEIKDNLKYNIQKLYDYNKDIYFRLTNSINL